MLVGVEVAVVEYGAKNGTDSVLGGVDAGARLLSPKPDDPADWLDGEAEELC